MEQHVFVNLEQIITLKYFHYKHKHQSINII